MLALQKALTRVLATDFAKTLQATQRTTTSQESSFLARHGLLWPTGAPHLVDVLLGGARKLVDTSGRASVLEVAQSVREHASGTVWGRNVSGLMIDILAGNHPTIFRGLLPDVAPLPPVDDIKKIKEMIEEFKKVLPVVPVIYKDIIQAIIDALKSILVICFENPWECLLYISMILMIVFLLVLLVLSVLKAIAAAKAGGGGGGGTGLSPNPLPFLPKVPKGDPDGTDTDPYPFGCDCLCDIWISVYRPSDTKYADQDGAVAYLLEFDLGWKSDFEACDFDCNLLLTSVVQRIAEAFASGSPAVFHMFDFEPEATLVDDNQVIDLPDDGKSFAAVPDASCL